MREREPGCTPRGKEFVRQASPLLSVEPGSATAAPRKRAARVGGSDARCTGRGVANRRGASRGGKERVGKVGVRGNGIISDLFYSYFSRAKEVSSARHLAACPGLPHAS